MNQTREEIKMERKCFRNVFVLMTVIFLLGGVVPVFSQEILATYGYGRQFLEREKVYGAKTYDIVVNGMMWEVDALFIGKSGLAVSTGISIITDFTTGLNVDPVIGMGYVYYNKFYVGGIMNIIPKPYIHYGSNDHADVFLNPTLVAGYDFGWFLVGGQVSYMHGFKSSINGFKFLLNVGVNAGKVFD
jgi:hypothetical protein